MARLLVYDAYENKVYTYANLRENDPMPYSTGTTLRVPWPPSQMRRNAYPTGMPLPYLRRVRFQASMAAIVVQSTGLPDLPRNSRTRRVVPVL